MQTNYTVSEKTYRKLVDELARGLLFSFAYVTCPKAKAVTNDDLLNALDHKHKSRREKLFAALKKDGVPESVLDNYRNMDFAFQMAEIRELLHRFSVRTDDEN